MVSAECRVQSAESSMSPFPGGVKPRQSRGVTGAKRLHLLFLYSAFCILTSALPASANPSQEDVFKSISSNVDNTMDGRKVFAFFVAVAGAVVMIVLINNRQQRVRVVIPKSLNHESKLLRELMKTAGLKSAQIRQLKLLRADLVEKGQPVENLVTLLLCPSLIKKARDVDERPRVIRK